MLQLEMRALKDKEDMLLELSEKSQRAVSQRGRGPVNNRVEMASPNRGLWPDAANNAFIKFNPSSLAFVRRRRCYSVPLKASERGECWLSAFTPCATACNSPWRPSRLFHMETPCWPSACMWIKAY